MADSIDSQSRPAAGTRPSVLVTGGRGFIGRHLVRCLQGHGCHVVSVDVAPLGSTPPIRDVMEIAADVRDYASMREIFTSRRFDKVYDLASFAEVGLSAASYTRNVDMTETMVALMREACVGKYIFYSTQFVFRRKNVLPAGEEEFDPADNYGASKVLSEQLIRRSMPPGSWLILRPTYVWGPGNKRFRDGLLYRVAKGQFLIPSAAEIFRLYAYVETLCEQTWRFGEMDFTALPGNVFYLTDPPIHLRVFCQYLVEALGRGRARPTPVRLIRLLGNIGGLAHALGLPFPIGKLQAEEMTHNFPVPYEPTLALTHCVTDYGLAAKHTVTWAMECADFANRLPYPGSGKRNAP